MPNWHKICEEIAETPRPHEVVRRRYLTAVSRLTKRNAILYYSGWLQKPRVSDANIDNSDMNGFMSLLAGWDESRRSKGLDLILHTPGGEVAATESLGNYLRAMFGENIHVYVPQMAMSCGTMLACIGKVIVMGKHSSLGPIDPQIGGMSARWMLEDLIRARNAIQRDQVNAHVWRPIISQYPVGMVSRCLNAIDWANNIAEQWLSEGMFKGESRALAKKAALALGGGVPSDDSTGNEGNKAKAHEQQFSSEQCCSEDIGLKIEKIENNQEIQDAVLSVHHACIWALAQTRAVKIMENHEGSDFIRSIGAN